MSIASVSPWRIFGCNKNVRENLHVLEESTLLYSAGCNVVAHNVQENTQRIIPVTEKGDGISVLAVSPNLNFFAAAKAGEPPTLSVFEIRSLRKRRALPLAPNTTLKSKEFAHLAFSADSKYLAAQLSAPDCILHFYAWEKGRLLATAVSGNALLPAKQSAFNPSDSTSMAVLNDREVLFYRYSEGVLRPESNTVIPRDLEAISITWVSGDRLLVAAKPNNIFVFEGGAFCHCIQIKHEVSIECLTLIPSGFAVGSTNGQIVINQTNLQENAEQIYEETSRFRVSDETGCSIRTLLYDAPNGIIIAQTITNQTYSFEMPGLDKKDGAVVASKIHMQGGHHGPVTGLDVCCRKSLFATCSVDNSIRVWNFQTNQCEVAKLFAEEPLSLSFHPSGLYILAGFVDKLRFMNVLIDDICVFRELPIRGCRICRFAKGGQYFAAVNGYNIQIFCTWTFKCLGILKGHNGKIMSLDWTLDDNYLLSTGSDGAVYTWSVHKCVRVSEHVLKGCTYTSAVSLFAKDGSIKVFAAGSEHLLKQIEGAHVVKEIKMPAMINQLCISYSGKMLFAGLTNGRLLSIRFPLVDGESASYLEHELHTGVINKLRISHDNQFLFTASDDGCVAVLKIGDRASVKEYAFPYADELLMTQQELKEKNAQLSDLQRMTQEIKLEHEFQIRLRDMTCSENLKDINEKLYQDLEALKITTSVLKMDKEKDQAQHHEDLQAARSKQYQTLNEREVENNAQLMVEYEKYQTLEARTSGMQDRYFKEMREYEELSSKQLILTQNQAEAKLRRRNEDIERLTEETAVKGREFDEILRQNELDTDFEIKGALAKYVKKLEIEYEDAARLKGENGIMKKKFGTLNKEIHDSKQLITKMQDESTRTREYIHSMEETIESLRKELENRDQVIQEREKKVYEMKKRNQELEKYKFVLDFKIKELREQIEPRERDIASMNRQSLEIFKELEITNKDEIFLKEQMEQIATQIKELKSDFNRAHRSRLDLDKEVRYFKADLEHAVTFYQDPTLLKRSVLNLKKKYPLDHIKKQDDILQDAVISELKDNKKFLKAEIKKLRRDDHATKLFYRNEHKHYIIENQKLLDAIKSIQSERVIIKKVDQPILQKVDLHHVALTALHSFKSPSLTAATNASSLPPIPKAVHFTTLPSLT